jgi:hypothetical protein
MPEISSKLEKISARTLADYNRQADEFWAGTRDHDVSQNIAALLDAIEGTPPLTLLDFGCGPGRDLKALTARGHVAIGLEGSPEFAAMARTHSGCEVWQQNFFALDLPPDTFDGVFANASLFHVPSRALPDVLASSTGASSPAACCSRRTRAATTGRAGPADATASTTISKRGAVTSPRQVLPSSNITSAPPACRASSSPGSQAYGASRRSRPPQILSTRIVNAGRIRLSLVRTRLESRRRPSFAAPVCASVPAGSSTT